MPSLLKPVVAVALVAGLGAAAYLTRSAWLPRLAGSHDDDKKPAAAGHDHAHEHPDRVKLSPQAQTSLGLVVEPLVSETFTRTLLIPGTVVDRPGVCDRAVSSPVVGVVVEMRVQDGDTVRAGDSVATIRLQSEAVQTAQADLFKATKDLQITLDNLKLLRSAPAETIAGTRVIEVENQERRQRATIAALRHELQTRGLRPDQVDAAAEGKFVTEMTVTAPPPAASHMHLTSTDPKAAPAHAGLTYEVTELKVRLGEQVAAGQVLCVLANHRHLYVEGRAFKSEAGVLEQAAQNGWRIRAEFAEEAGGWPPFDAGLTIRHLANTVDPVSRTFAFFLPLDNQARTYTRDGQTFMVWRFRPGQRVRLKVPAAQMDDVFVLPAAALVREGVEAFVFRQNGDLFERKPVRVLYEDRSDVVLADDGSVGPGQFVVRNHAAALNRALKSAAAGDEHGHDHDH
jgi:multidrug efflux pump subunit AcrA (membrane-fusion protein)